MNRIKTVFIALAVIFVSAGIAQAATTIGTYITTGGALTVGGISLFGGNGVATTTIDTSGNLSVVGLATLSGGATTTQITLLFGDTIKNTTASTTVVSGTLAPGLLSVAGLSALTGGATIGGGSTLNKISKGTCFLIANTVIAASSTGFEDCAATGAAAGDVVFVNFATTSPAMPAYGIRLLGANASSTTPGYITFELLNLTGAAIVPAATSNFGSSTQYMDIH